MKKILLCVPSTASNRILAQKMKNYTIAREFDFEILTSSAEAIRNQIKLEDIDILLLAPEYKDLKSIFEKEFEVYTKVIDEQDYNAMYIEKLVDSLMELIEY